jgi:hypothetical protein
MGRATPKKMAGMHRERSKKHRSKQMEKSWHWIELDGGASLEQSRPEPGCRTI